MAVKKPIKPAPKPAAPAPHFGGGSSGSSAHFAPPPPPPPPKQNPAHVTHVVHPTASPAPHPATAPSPRFANKFVSGTPDAYKPAIAAAAAKYNVPSAIISGLLKQESGFDPKAVSPVGALGIAQFMPSTAKTMGINPSDPTQAINGAASYLRSSLNTFNGDMSKALASYNAGTGAVQEYGGIPPYPETQNYVKSILADASKADEAVDQEVNNPTQAPSDTVGNVQQQIRDLQSMNKATGVGIKSAQANVAGIGKSVGQIHSGLTGMTPAVNQLGSQWNSLGTNVNGLYNSVKALLAQRQQQQGIGQLSQAFNASRALALPKAPVNYGSVSAGGVSSGGGGANYQYGGAIPSTSSNTQQNNQQQQQQVAAPTLAGYPTAPSGTTSFGPISV